MLVALVCANAVWANRTSDTDGRFDANLLQVEEGRFLGQQVPDVSVVTESGTKALSELIAGKPTILLMAYYSCGHSCPATIHNLSQMKIDAQDSDYQVIVLSFDANDTIANMQNAMSTIGQVPDNWTFGLLAQEQSTRLTDSLGYKFFYSEQEQTFVHPAVLVFLSPEGKVMRYLYGNEPRAQDVELALVESRNRAPHLNEIVEMIKLTCFQFDASKSRYRIHPTIVLGGAGFGVLGLVGLVTLVSRKDSKGGQ
ncbi:MAG: SCO family protein [Halieaceae bacterium]|jgi:protein SCO1|nr:SCO family protein [Halieaceae bacterium]